MFKIVNFHYIKSHGYFIATINQKRIQIDYYFVDNLLTNVANEHKSASFTIDAETFGISV